MATVCSELSQSPTDYHLITYCNHLAETHFRIASNLHSLLKKSTNWPGQGCQAETSTLHS